MVLIGTSASAEEFQAKSATTAAPRQVEATLEAMALPPSDPDAARENRQSRLSDHLEPGPPLREVPSAEALEAIMQPPETTVGKPGNPVTLLRNRGLTDAETSNITSQVGEPSVAVRGQEILMTGNWYAAFSTDGGTSFTYINASTTFPNVNGGFCCDQLAIYDSQNDLMIWYLQYIEDGSQNTGRLAVAQGNDIVNQQWRFYDFTPLNVGNWNNQWFDYPDFAVGENFLYVSTNTFSTPGDNFTRAVVLRLPLAQLAAYQGFTYNYFDVTNDFSLRPTQGATDTMYFAGHQATNTLRVFTWPENNTTITTNDVGVQLWANATRVAPGPSGNDWLGRVDARITGAWMSGNEIGFAWTASQDANFPFPHVRVAVLDRNTMAIVRQPHIWNSNYAFAYPAAAPNANGVVGLSVAYGGGSQFEPSHAVGFFDTSTTSWDLVVTANGTHGPSANRWGDYLAVRPHGAQGQRETWVATGFTQQGGPQASDIQVRYVHFEEGGQPPLPLQISLVLDPNNTLDNGQTTTLRATVTSGGNPVAGETVTFTSTNTGLATVSPASDVTDTNGVAETTVTGRANSRDTVPVKAEAGGITATIPVRVPDLSMIAFALLFIGIVLLGILVRRRRLANTI